MKIVLQPMPGAPPIEGGVCVGTIDGEPLCYVGRTPHAATQPLVHSEIAEDLLDAIEDVCAPLFGGDWLTPLHVVSGLHQRSVQRDRIVKYGLPAGVLRALGEARAVLGDPETARAVGYVMQGLALLYRRDQVAMRELAREFRAGHRQTDPLISAGGAALKVAASIVHSMLEGKAEPFQRLRAESRDRINSSSGES